MKNLFSWKTFVQDKHVYMLKRELLKIRKVHVVSYERFTSMYMYIFINICIHIYLTHISLYIYCKGYCESSNTSLFVYRYTVIHTGYCDNRNIGLLSSNTWSKCKIYLYIYIYIFIYIYIYIQVIRLLLLLIYYIIIFIYNIYTDIYTYIYIYTE